jgi:hypothetical protein
VKKAEINSKNWKAIKNLEYLPDLGASKRPIVTIQHNAK